MNFTVYAYWDTLQIQQTFNAIHALIYGSDYAGLIKFLLMVGMISISLAALVSRWQLIDLWKWIIMVVIVNGILIGPQTTVQIVDRTGTSGTTAVSGVPLGLAAIASSASTIGDYLTTSFETVFSLPNDLTLQNNGLLFGHRLMQQRLLARVQNPIVMQNVMGFYRECIWPDLATGNISMQQIQQDPDIWTNVFNNTNPALYDTYNNPTAPSTSVTDTCPNVYTALTNEIKSEEANISQNTANQNGYTLAAYKAALANSSNYLLGVSQSADQILQQSIVANTLIDAQYTIPSQMGDTAQAATALAEAQSIRSFNTQYSTMANMAEDVMPKIRVAIELVCYAVFPIMAVLAIIAGQHALGILKQYIMALLWVQLWPPFYAVLNYIMTSSAATSMTTAVSSIPSGGGLTLQYYNYLGTAGASDQAIAGFLTVSIPVIAWTLLQGGMSMAGAVGGAFAGAGQIGSQQGLGNIQEGNVNTHNTSQDNVNSHNTNVNHSNTAPTLDWAQPGATMSTMTNMNGARVTTAGDGSQTINNALSNTGGTVHFGSEIQAAFSAKATQSSEEAEKHSVQAVTAEVAALNVAQKYVHGETKAQQSQHIDSVQEGSSIHDAMQYTNQFVTKFAKSHAITQEKASQILAQARVEMKTPGLITAVEPLTAVGSLGTNNSTSSADKRTWNDAQEAMKNTSYSKSLEIMEDAKKQDSFNTSDSATKNAAQEMQQSLNNSTTEQQSASVEISKKNAYAEAAEKAQRLAFGSDTNMYQEFTNWAKEKKGLNVEQLASIEKNRGEDANRLHSEFINDNTDKFMQESGIHFASPNRTLPKSQNDVENRYNHVSSAAYNAAKKGIKEADKDHHKKVSHAQKVGGVSPDAAPKNNVAPTVDARLIQGASDITQGKQDVLKNDGGIENEVQTQEVKTGNHLFATTAQNGLAAVTGLGEQKLFQNLADFTGYNNVGDFRDSNAVFAKEDADKASQLTTGQAVLRTGIDVAGLALGAVGGRAVAYLGAKAGVLGTMPEIVSTEVAPAVDKWAVGEGSTAAENAAGKEVANVGEGAGRPGGNTYEAHHKGNIPAKTETGLVGTPDEKARLLAMEIFGAGVGVTVAGAVPEVGEWAGNYVANGAEYMHDTWQQAFTPAHTDTESEHSPVPASAPAASAHDAAPAAAESAPTHVDHAAGSTHGHKHAHVPATPAHEATPASAEGSTPLNVNLGPASLTWAGFGDDNKTQPNHASAPAPDAGQELHPSTEPHYPSEPASAPSPTATHSAASAPEPTQPHVPAATGHVVTPASAESAPTHVNHATESTHGHKHAHVPAAPVHESTPASAEGSSPLNVNLGPASLTWPGMGDDKKTESNPSTTPSQNANHQPTQPRNDTDTSASPPTTSR